MKLSADDALLRLQQGNRRFVEGVLSLETLISHAQSRRAAQAAGQEPFAVILGCSDSRAPAEMLFDQGLGDLFVIRVAGNIAAPSQIGSIEFAVARFGVKLVVVLGHSQCGAVLATLDALQRPQGSSPGLAAIVDRIKPALAPLIDPECSCDDQGLVERAVRANVRATVNMLRHGSALLERQMAENGLRIIGAEYALATGEVEFLPAL